MTDERLAPPSIHPNQPTDDAARSRGAALLTVVAADLDAAQRQPAPAATAASDMEQALARFRSLDAENVDLRETVRTLTARTEDDAKVHAQEELRLGDQIKFLMQQNGNLQQQRDTFANYAIEVKTRMTSLTVLMAENAQHVESAISSTMEEIRRFTADRVDALADLMLTNAATASKLVEEALEAAKNDTIVRLQTERQTA